MRRHVFALTVAAFLFQISGVLAQYPIAKPKVPPGTPTTGAAAVALLSTGVDYTSPFVFTRLARDGEGEIIGYDAVDDDRRPYAPASATSAPRQGGNAASLIESWPMRFVHVRVDPEKSETLARAVQWISRSPARIVIVPMWSADKATWEAFRAAAAANANLLFIVAAGDDGADIDAAPVYPASFKLDNMIVVSAIAAKDATTKPNVGARTVDLFVAPAAAVREAPASLGGRPRSSREAALDVAFYFFCHKPPPALQRREHLQAKSPADVRRIFVTKAKQEQGWPGPVLEACHGMLPPF